MHRSEAMKTMARTTAGILPLLLFGFLALIGTSTSTAVAVSEPAPSFSLARLFNIASSVAKRNEEKRKLQGYATPQCSNGLDGYETADVCCPLSCGKCGGAGCSKLGEGCCTRRVKESGDLCSETNAAPCVIRDDDRDDEDDANFVEAGTQTVVSESTTAFDERPGAPNGNGCGDRGCMPSLAYDGVIDDIESRWSCAEKLLDGAQCEITFSFESPQDLVGMRVSFFKGDERTRTLKVIINGKKVGEFGSTPGAITTSYDIEKNDVRTVTLEAIGLGRDEWISLLEVNFLVVPEGS
eukprot:g19635.t1